MQLSHPTPGSSPGSSSPIYHGVNGRPRAGAQWPAPVLSWPPRRRRPAMPARELLRLVAAVAMGVVIGFLLAL